MRHLSIRLKITLWFSGALVLVVAITYFAILAVSSQVIQKTVRDSLLHTVEDNVDEVEFYADLSGMDPHEVDYFLQYGEGYLEVDDDFLDAVGGVCTGLYRTDGTLLYGENPVARELNGLEFRDSVVQRETVAGTVYYVFDRKLTGEGLAGLWLRGVVSERQGETQLHTISKLSLIALPLLLLLAIGGGYLIARRMLRPVQRISETAAGIESGGDLKRRIELGPGGDELHQLADSFNRMIGRLDRAFEAEHQFASDASHELRTPVSVILAQCEYSLEEEREAEEYRRALEVIRRQGRRMAKLVGEMLEFVRLENGRGAVRERVALTELVRSVCADMALIRTSGIELSCEAEENLFVRGDAGLLERLLANLIGNAYRYGRENGHIRVRLRRDGDGAVLSVADDGIGIEKEEQENIFRRFYRVDRSRAEGGTGIGLAMAAEIARIHGGTLGVESEPGRGSTFTLRLPGDF